MTVGSYSLDSACFFGRIADWSPSFYACGILPLRERGEREKNEREREKREKMIDDLYSGFRVVEPSIVQEAIRRLLHTNTSPAVSVFEELIDEMIPVGIKYR